MIVKPGRLLSFWMSLLTLALLANISVAGEKAPEPKDPADDILKEVDPKPKTPAATTPKRLTPKQAARLRAKLKAVTKRMYRDAKTFFWQDQWDRCITECDEILKRDPAHLKAQKLKYQSERAKLDHKLKMLEQVSKMRDDEAIADLDKASMFPEKKPPLSRPVKAPPILPLPIRIAKPVKSEKMLAMEQKLNQRVDLNLLDVDLAFLFSTLHRISGVNIIADEESLADKKLKILVEDMPLKEILHFIVRKYPDIAYTVTENAVWITQIEDGGNHPGMEPRIHPLNCGLVVTTPMKTSAKSTTRRPGAGGRPTVPGAAPGAAPGAPPEPNITSLEEVLTWMEGWPDWPGGSSYSIDKTNSSLLLVTTPAMHEKVAAMLQLVDRPPIQVLISTRFITISVDDLSDLGLDFSMNTKPGQDIVLGVGSGTDLGVSAGTGITAIVKGEDTDPLFTATLRALQQKGRAKVLSAPQIITLNNQKGVIDLSTKFSYQEEWVEIKTVDVVGDNGNTIERVTSFKPQMNRNGETGFKLFVTPSVGRDLKHIVLEIEPIIKDLEGELSRFSETQIIVLQEDESPPPIPQPIVHEQTLRTRMVLEDGGMVVIGGLMSQDTEKTVTKVPILGDIPIIGLLFRRTQDTVKKSHLVIVVKAQIIHPSGRTYVDNGGAAGGGTKSARPATGPWFGYPEPGR
jgi:Bacterial type II and III secretion system protein